MVDVIFNNKDKLRYQAKKQPVENQHLYKLNDPGNSDFDQIYMIIVNIDKGETFIDLQLFVNLITKSTRTKELQSLCVPPIHVGFLPARDLRVKSRRGQ